MENRKNAGLSLVAMAELCLCNFAYMADLVIIPIGDAIFSAYPDAPTGLLNFILSGPQLIMVASMLLSTALMKRFRKRTLILAGFTVFTVSSCLGAAVDNALYVAVLRGVTGFSGGLCTPVALSLINETYCDDPEKAGAMVGYFSSTNALFGLVMSVAAGILCAARWQNAFKVYYAAVPMLILLFLFLPKGESPSGMEKTADAGQEKIPWGQLAPVLLAVVVGAILVNACNYLSSVYIAEKALGDSSFSGVFAAVITLCTAIVSALFGVLYKRLRRYSGAVMFVLAAVCYLLLYIAGGKAVALLGAAVNGMAYGFLASYYAAVITDFVPASKMDTATPLVLAAMGIGSFLSTYAAFGVMGMFGKDTLSAVFPHLLLLCLLGAAISVLAIRRMKKAAPAAK